MALNVSMAIDTDTGERVSILRKAAGEYIKGIWTVTSEDTPIKALASVQQPTKQEIELFTGLERDKDMKTFYINKKLRASSEFGEAQADVISWNSRLYRVMKLGEWQSYGYNIGIGVRIE